MRLRLDWWLLITYLLGAVLGSVMLSSISPERLPQHILMLVLGLIFFVYLSSQESAVYKTFAPLAYLTSLILLLITIVIGDTIRGATRWIPLGTFQLQTAEISKPLLILAFAYMLERFPPRNLRNIFFNFISFIIPTFLIFRQPDLGTALVVTAIWLTQIFVAGIPWGYVISSLAAFFLSLPLLPHFLHDYQLKRLTTFLDPFSDPLGSGYNVIQSIIAVGSGGIFGKGLGHGTQSHLRFLPERHTDFAFASLAEELGLIGTLFVLGIMSSFIYRLLSTLTHSETKGNRYILSGVLAYFAFQSLVNIGMNIGLAPVTGVTLPLISYGGSSILATGIILGLASSVIVSSKTIRLLEIR